MTVKPGSLAGPDAVTLDRVVIVKRHDGTVVAGHRAYTCALANNHGRITGDLEVA